MRDHRPPARPAPAFPIRMIALDIDGTLVGTDFAIAARTREAIGEAVARGVRASLATGRRATSALTYATELGLVEPVIAHQGAVVREMPATPGRIGRLLHHESLPAAVTLDAIRWCHAHGLHPHVNTLERIVVWAGDPNFDDYSAYLGTRPDVVDDFETAITRPTSKVIALGEAGVPMTVLADARRAFAGRAEVTVSHPQFLEFIAPGVSKGRAVAWLAHRAGIPLGQVMAIGDALNDLEMIQATGHGTAMAGAPPEVLAAARYVAPPVEDQGSAALIEQLVLADPATAAANAARLAAEATAIARPVAPGLPRSA